MTTKPVSIRTHLRRLYMAIQAFQMWEATKATRPEGGPSATYSAAISVPLSTAKAVADGLDEALKSVARLNRRAQEAEREIDHAARVRELEEALASRERELAAVKASLRRVTAQRDMAREELRAAQRPVTE